MDRSTRSCNGTARVVASPPALPRPPARVLEFDAHLVLPDVATRQLRLSPSPGQLCVNTTDRLVTFTYRRKKSGAFQRTLHAPHKCVVAALALQLWSRASSSTLRCRFLSERDRECCLEVLQIMGVRVVDVTPTRFLRVESTHAQRMGHGEDQYIAELNALATTLTHPRHAQGVITSVSAYSASDQIATDIATISRAIFGGHGDQYVTVPPPPLS